MTEQDFIPNIAARDLLADKTDLTKGSITAEAPSNIALIKYWGKYAKQLPKNPSLSLTLDRCKTTTTLEFEKKNHPENPDLDFDFEIYLDDRKIDAFKPKIAQFFDRIFPYVPFLKNYKFTINTSNSFPHSSGIASSASGMAALSICLVELEKKLYPNRSGSFFKRKASFLARLGSGSACRSIDGGLVVWGAHPDIENSSDLFGIKYPDEIHEVFENYQDVILLVDEGEKQVSSSVGHNLMKGHPFSEQRFLQAKENLSALKQILKTGDLSAFMEIVESEALSLHAMMMTSKPYFVLMKPNTLKVINKIWAFRGKTGSNVCFTLDAGANVHVLFPLGEKEKVARFIKNELSEFCQDGNYISDAVGNGAIVKKS